MQPEAPRGVQREVSRAEFLNLFAAVFLPMFLAAVDQTLLATATPAIAASLGGLRDTSWIVVGYLLAAATITPVYGRLGDRRGRRDQQHVAPASSIAEAPIDRRDGRGGEQVADHDPRRVAQAAE